MDPYSLLVSSIYKIAKLGSLGKTKGVRSFLAITLLFFFPPTLGADALFLRPQENSSLVRRDLLPLETNQLRELSNNLAVLASQALRKNSPAHNRALSQLLAISLELDPVNQRARNTLKQHLKNQLPALENHNHSVVSLRAVEATVLWLLSNDAQKSSCSLALLILDPISVLYPESKISRHAIKKGESQRWEGVVQPIIAFRSPFLSTLISPVTQKAKELPAAQVESKELFFPENEVLTPLRFESSDLLSLTCANVRISLGFKKSEIEKEPFSLIFKPALPKELGLAIENHVFEAIRKRHETLPLGYIAEINISSKSYPEENGLALTGPISLLIHAALTNTDLHQNLIFLAEIQSGGSNLRLPTRGWDYLRFSKGIEYSNSTRLLVPTCAALQVRALLATRNTNNNYALEIFGVENLDQALVLSASTDNSESLAQTSKLYAEYRKLSFDQDTLDPLNRAKNRGILESIVSLNPNHLSAKIMLALFNTHEKYYLDKETLKLEFTACLDLISLALAKVHLPAEADQHVLHARRKDLDNIRRLLHSRLAPLQTSIPKEQRDIFERFFSILVEAKEYFIANEKGMRSPSRLSSSEKKLEILQAEFLELRQSIEELGTNAK